MKTPLPGNHDRKTTHPVKRRTRSALAGRCLPLTLRRVTCYGNANALQGNDRIAACSRTGRCALRLLMAPINSGSLRPPGAYDDDELRRLLHEAGAKRGGGKDGEEWWYLAEREDEYIARLRGDVWHRALSDRCAELHSVLR